jgi:hypothetical protein
MDIQNGPFSGWSLLIKRGPITERNTALSHIPIHRIHRALPEVPFSATHALIPGPPASKIKVCAAITNDQSEDATSPHSTRIPWRVQSGPGRTESRMKWFVVIEDPRHCTNSNIRKALDDWTGYKKVDKPEIPQCTRRTRFVALPSTSDIFLAGLIRKKSEKQPSRKERDKGKNDDYLKKWVR